MEILIAMTANAFAEDVQAAKGAGMKATSPNPSIFCKWWKH